MDTFRRRIVVYPHQLVFPHRGVDRYPGVGITLVEDPLFFRQYRFHPYKLAFHRETMTAWRLRALEHRRKMGGSTDIVILRSEEIEMSGDTVKILARQGIRVLTLLDPVDDWLEQRIRAAADQTGIEIETIDNPTFLLSRSELDAYLFDGTDGKRSLRMAHFYRYMRRSYNVLLDEQGGPVGGSWSFDTENRKKIPRSITPPDPMLPDRFRALGSVNGSVVGGGAGGAGAQGGSHGGGAGGAGAESRENQTFGIGTAQPYPTTNAEALLWLDRFLETRLGRFGDYEDAIDDRDDQWFHSLLSPMLNVGLLTPDVVVKRTLEAARGENEAAALPLNSVEGFLRQVIGWREFMRLTYRTLGRRMRSTNYWNHTRPMPKAFYDGTTGLVPLDRAIAKTNRLAWTHHIERLMVIGNAMLLCEIDPDAVYQWFMELYIDAYDWVMVPNVYGMSQFADGGLITTKPYISGSNYIRKMSNMPNGEWTEIWDGLYWRFIDRHREFFSANPRMTMMVRQLDRMDDKRCNRLWSAAQSFLDTI